MYSEFSPERTEPFAGANDASSRPLKDAVAQDHVGLRERLVPYRGSILDLVEDHITLGDSELTREYIDHDDAVAIVAIRDGECGEEVLLIRQYRHPIRRMMWEIPAGLLDIEGEPPLQAAARELREETDMVADSYEPLVNFFVSPGCSAERLHVFLARGVHRAESVFERTEEESEIEVSWHPLDEVVTAILAGDLACPTLVSGVLAYALRMRMGN
ncbi:NUDIX hydrolase [Arcanobacterium haemolyticum]|nr:NUDIX hydrolase [Arcanobacterium haemolyticum]